MSDSIFPCPTCGCRLYNDIGPCDGDSKLAEAFAAGVRAMRDKIAAHFENLECNHLVGWRHLRFAAEETRNVPDPPHETPKAP